MRHIKRFVAAHLDLTAFLGFVVLVLLMGVVLNSTESLTVALVVGTAFVVVGKISSRGARQPSDS